MLQQGQVQNPVLQGSVQLYTPYSSHFSWSSPRSFTAWWLLQRGVGILQIRACFSAQPCSACCTLSSPCTQSCKSCVKKKCSLPLTTISFLPAFHSPPILPLGKLLWMAISSLRYYLDFLWALRTQEIDSLLDLSHLKCYWQTARWIQLPKFSMATMPMLTDFIPAVHHLALFSHLFLTEQQNGFLAVGLLSVNFKYLCWSETLHQENCWFLFIYSFLTGGRKQEKYNAKRQPGWFKFVRVKATKVRILKQDASSELNCIWHFQLFLAWNSMPDCEWKDAALWKPVRLFLLPSYSEGKENALFLAVAGLISYMVSMFNSLDSQKESTAIIHLSGRTCSRLWHLLI